jgi:hypothetical protein
LIFDRRTPCGGCLSSFEGSLYCSRTSFGVSLIAALTLLFCPRSGVYSDVDSQAWLSGVGKLCHVFCKLDQKMGLAALRNPSKNEQST